MEFDSPWRIHWQPGNPVDRKSLEAVRACHPLSVTIDIGDPGQLDSLELPWEGVSLVILYRGWRHHQGNITAPPVTRWEFPIEGPGEAVELVERSFMGLPPDKAAFRWFPRRGGLEDLPPILETVSGSGCGLTLPNRPAGVITNEGPEAFPGGEEHSAKILARLKGLAGDLDTRRLRVHDFILTQTLGLESVEPGGCEAANSMAFVDSRGTVYPCETLMIPLGDLKRESLETIWASPLRVRLRRDVTSVPGVCSPCPHLAGCRGGCRGAVYHLSGHYGAPDPLCYPDIMGRGHESDEDE